MPNLQNKKPVMKNFKNKNTWKWMWVDTLKKRSNYVVCWDIIGKYQGRSHEFNLGGQSLKYNLV